MLTAAEIQKERELKEEIRKDEVKRIVAKQRRLKEKHSEVASEESERKRIENTKDVDGKLYWDKVREDADRMISQGPAGYNDWAVGMSNLISHFLLLNKATIYDPIFPFREEVMGIKALVVYGIWRAPTGWISDQIDKLTFPDRKLPELHLSTTINEKGSVDILATRDGQDLTKVEDPNDKAQELYHRLRVGVTAWAKIHGYDCKENPDEPGKMAFYTDPGDVKMTQEKFKELNDNREEALDTFLSARFDMPLSYNLSL
jgi:hypothetical protein